MMKNETNQKNPISRIINSFLFRGRETSKEMNKGFYQTCLHVIEGKDMQINVDFSLWGEKSSYFSRNMKGFQ